MCGIVGIVDYSSAKMFSTDKEKLWMMLLMNTIRGESSTGIFGVYSKESKIDLIKTLGGPYSLLNYKNTDKFFNRIQSDYTAVIGHGRAPTLGKVTVQNAHPFIQEHITLVHNGTTTNFEELQTKWATKGQFEVDSNLIAYALSTNENATEVIKEIRGGCCLVWYDSKKNVIRVYRNDDRPMFVVHDINKKQYYLSSDKAVHMYNKEKFTISGEPYSLEAHKIHTFSFDSPIITTEEVPRPPVRHYSGSSSMGGYRGNYNYYEDDEGYGVAKVSHIQEREFKLGDKLLMTAAEQKETESLYLFSGRTCSPDWYEVSAVTAVKKKDCPDPNEMIKAYGIYGSIKAIIYDPAHPFWLPNYKVFLENITVFNTYQDWAVFKDKQKEDEKKSVTLADGTIMSKIRFTALALNGCIDKQCNNKAIWPEDYEDCMMMSGGLLCPDCSSIISGSVKQGAVH